MFLKAKYHGLGRYKKLSVDNIIYCCIPFLFEKLVFYGIQGTDTGLGRRIDIREDELHVVPLWARGRRPPQLKAQGPPRVKPSEATEDFLATRFARTRVVTDIKSSRTGSIYGNLKNSSSHSSSTIRGPGLVSQ